ncbi:MAG TPA: hypothetical protein VK582_15970 [Pyrinomonadaceae bacterium]|nr:hypothetical protein [Pyrinomonadaceae bacterium]
MESKRPAAQQRSDLKNPKAASFEENLSREVTGSDVDDGNPIDSNASSVITDEVIRHRIRTLIDQKPKPSTLRTISTHPLLVVVVGGFMGVLLTHYYTSQQKDLEYNRVIQQQELARQESFSDEVNKIRVQKLGEVWEEIDKNEVTLDGLLDRANKTSGSNKKDFDEIDKLINQDLLIINENRFWLGQSTHHQLKDYMDKTGRYALDMLLGPPGIDLNEALEKREQAKQNIVHLRIMFLKGEPEPTK